MLDATELSALVERTAYPLMVEEYEQAAPVYPRLARVVDIASSPELSYGDKGTVLEGTDGFKRREDGQEVEHDKPGPGYTWRLGIKQDARRMDIPQRLMSTLVANGRLASYVADQVRGWGSDAVNAKDEYLAGLFQKGTLTAGSLVYFDNNFPGETDTNAGFIYDGLPWFDTAHTITGVSGTTFANHTASLTLTSANLETVLIAMRSTNARTERNQKRFGSIRPDVLVVPPQLRRTAAKILESELEPGSANNDINVHRGTLDMVVWDFLSDDTDAWWVGQARRGVRFYDGGMPEIRTSFNEERKLWVTTAETRYGAAVDNFRYWYAANKAAS